MTDNVQDSPVQLDAFFGTAVEEPTADTDIAVTSSATQADDKPVVADPAKADAKKDAEPPKVVPVSELIAERQRRQRAERDIAGYKARYESNNFKAEPFAEQSELEELELKMVDDTVEVTAKDRVRYGELCRAQARHESAQAGRKEKFVNEHSTRAAWQTTVQSSIADYMAENPESKDDFEFSRVLTQAEQKQVWDAGENAGKVMHDLIVARTAKLRVKADGGSKPVETRPKQQTQKVAAEDDSPVEVSDFVKFAGG